MGLAKTYRDDEPAEFEDYPVSFTTRPAMWDGILTNRTSISFDGTKCTGIKDNLHANLLVLILSRPISDRMFKRKRAAIASLPSNPSVQITNPVVVAGYGTSMKNKVYCSFPISYFSSLSEMGTVRPRQGDLHAVYVDTYTQDQCKQLWKAYYSFTSAERPNSGDTVNFGYNKPFPNDFVCVNYTVKLCDDVRMVLLLL